MLIPSLWQAVRTLVVLIGLIITIVVIFKKPAKTRQLFEIIYSEALLIGFAAALLGAILMSNFTDPIANIGFHISPVGLCIMFASSIYYLVMIKLGKIVAPRSEYVVVRNLAIIGVIIIIMLAIFRVL